MPIDPEVVIERLEAKLDRSTENLLKTERLLDDAAEELRILRKVVAWLDNAAKHGVMPLWYGLVDVSEGKCTLIEYVQGQIKKEREATITLMQSLVKQEREQGPG